MEFTQYLPDLLQLLHLIVAVLTMVAFGCIGGVLCGTKRDPVFDVFVGFGAVTGTMTVLGVLLKIPFSWMAIGFWLIASGAVYHLWRRRVHPGVPRFPVALTVKILALALPVLLTVSAMRASQWDEFSQWLFNALYIYRFDAFPGEGLPKSASYFPAYPYGNQLYSYLVSFGSGTFVEMGVAFGNVLLLLALAPVYVSMLGKGSDAVTERLKDWPAAALGILGVTILSTTFVQKLIFTAYADTATAVLLAALGVLLWRILNDLAETGYHSRTLALQFAFACMFFVNIKQTNLVLLMLLIVAGFAVALRDPDIKVGNYLKCLAIMLTLPFAVYLSWRFHVAQNITGGEFSILPIDTWLLDHTFAILARMVSIASKKGAFFGMMFAILGAGLWCFMAKRGGPYGRFLFLTGTVFIGYWMFLWAMYITAFGEYQGTRAISFWRYNVQLGLLGALTAAVAYGMFYKRYLFTWFSAGSRLRFTVSVFIVLGVFVSPIAFNHKLRIDIRPQFQHMRLAGQEMVNLVPKGAVLAILDPKGQGFADMIVKYEILGFSEYNPTPRFVTRLGAGADRWAKLSPEIEKSKISHIWIHQTTDWYASGFGLENLRNDGSTLISRSGNGGWEIQKFWPYGGYTDPYSLPD